MKKNILTIVILALCLFNLVLTALLIFTVLPTTKKTDALITQVASVIQLELTGYGENNYSATDLEDYKIEQSLTKNLKAGQDGKEHYATMDYVSVSVNKKSEDYGTYNKKLTENKYDSKIMDIVGTALNGYTFEELTSEQGQKDVKSDVLKEIKKYFGSADFIVDISFNIFCS